MNLWKEYIRVTDNRHNELGIEPTAIEKRLEEISNPLGLTSEYSSHKGTFNELKLKHNLKRKDK